MAGSHPISKPPDQASYALPTFEVVNGLTGYVEATGIARALRRAVMARV